MNVTRKKVSDTAVVETVLEDARWDEEQLAAWAERAARMTLSHIGLAPEGFEIALLACDDTRIAELNTTFRAKAAATNVLSWPAWDLAPDTEGDTPARPEAGTPDMPESLGDIALSYDTCVNEARMQGKSFDDHVTHLIVHAVLHLLGYDHIRDKDAALMEETEVQILAQLGVSNPYALDADMQS